MLCNWRLKESECERPRALGGVLMTCAIRGCRILTNGKPYCIEHLDALPYVRRIKSELSKPDTTASGHLAQDIRAQLALNGTMTYGRLSRELFAPMNRIAACVKVLERSGVVGTSPLRDRQGRVKFVAYLPKKQGVVA